MDKIIGLRDKEIMKEKKSEGVDNMHHSCLLVRRHE